MPLVTVPICFPLLIAVGEIIEYLYLSVAPDLNENAFKMLLICGSFDTYLE